MALHLTIEDRRKLLRDAQTYFTAAERFVNCCRHLDPTSAVPIPAIQSDIARWEGQLHFSSGHILRFREIYRKHADDLVERVASFDFRQKHSDEVTFRVDAHGLAIWDGEEFHLDLPGNIQYQDGDKKLGEFSLKHFTIIDMIYLINLHLGGEEMPWE